MPGEEVGGILPRIIVVTAGISGQSAYVYVAYADDDIGTGFTTTFDETKDYIAFLPSSDLIPSPVAADFDGLWKNYKGAQGIQGPPGSGVSDGDKGDVTASSSGNTWTINAGAVTYSKIQDVSPDTLLGRSSPTPGVIEEIACTAAGRALLDDETASDQRTTLGLGALAVLNTVGSGEIDANAVGSSQIASGAVGSDELATAALTPIKKAAEVTLTDAATVAIDCSLSEDFYLSTANSRTLGAPTGTPRLGQFMTILIKNTSGGAITPVLTTGAGGFIYSTDIDEMPEIPAGASAYHGFKWNSHANRWVFIAHTSAGVI